MAVRINSGESSFRWGSEGAGEVLFHSPETGRIAVLGKRVSATQNIQVWISEDDGASWSEADTANRPTNFYGDDFLIGAVGCLVGTSLYIAHHALSPYGLAVVEFSLETLEYGNVYTGGPVAAPLSFTYECVSAVVPLPGERLRILYLTDLPSFSYNTKVVDLDLTSGTWSSPVQVNATSNNSHYPYGLYAGKDGRTHAFYHDDASLPAGQRGLHRTVNEDLSLEAEQEILGADGLQIQKSGWWAGESKYLAAAGAVRIAVPFVSPLLGSSPEDYYPVKLLIGDSEDEPSWSVVTLSEDPVYAVTGAGDGTLAGCCFFGHLNGIHTVHLGQSVASLPRSDSEVDLFRRRYLGSVGASNLVSAGSGTDAVTGCRVRAVNGGLGVLFVIDYSEVWFEKIALDFCTG